MKPVVETFYLAFAVVGVFITLLFYQLSWIVWALLINAITFVVYREDKRLSKQFANQIGYRTVLAERQIVGHRHRYNRIPEKFLILLGLLGGWIGAIFAQQIFRHKTNKLWFQIWFFCSVVVYIAAMTVIYINDPEKNVFRM